MGSNPELTFMSAFTGYVLARASCQLVLNPRWLAQRGNSCR